MSLRFRRSVRILPGVRLNLGLHGAGVSVGSRGLHVGMNRRGMYSSVGIPGTGIYAVHHVRKGEHASVAGSAGGFVVGLLIVIALIVVVQVCLVLLAKWRPRKADLNFISLQIPIPPENRDTKQVQSITDRWRPVFRDPRLAPAWDQIEDFLRKNRFL